MDGDTRGGAALSIKSVVDKPIKFIGTTADEVEQFRIGYLGKKGHITKLFACFGWIPS